jgi:hypothetical protein
LRWSTARARSPARKNAAAAASRIATTRSIASARSSVSRFGQHHADRRVVAGASLCRALVPAHRFVVRVHGARLVAGALAVGRRLRELAGRAEIVRDHLGERRRVGPAGEHPRDAQVERAHLIRQQLTVDRVAGERVPELKTVRHLVAHVEQLQVAQALQRRDQRLERDAGDLGDEVGAEAAPEQRRRRQHAALARRAAVEAFADDRVQGERQRVRRLHRAGPLAVDDVAQQLFGKQWVAGRAAQHVAQHLGRKLGVGQRAAQQTFALVVVERAEPQQRDAVAPQQPPERHEQRVRRDDLVVAIRSDDQHPPRGGALGQHVEDPEQLGVGPVQVVERQHRGAALRDAVERGQHRGELLVARRAALVERAAAVERPQHLRERAERPPSEFPAGRRRDAVPARREPRAELAHQPRLSDPGLACDQNEAAVTLGRRSAPCAKMLQLDDAAYELTADDAFRNHLGSETPFVRRRSRPSANVRQYGKSDQVAELGVLSPCVGVVCSVPRAPRNVAPRNDASTCSTTLAGTRGAVPAPLPPLSELPPPRRPIPPPPGDPPPPGNPPPRPPPRE